MTISTVTVSLNINEMCHIAIGLHKLDQSLEVIALREKLADAISDQILDEES